MPLHYPDGILAEHLHTRRSAGLFDVSHIGQIAVFADSGGESTGGKSTGDESTAAALESLMPVDILSLPGGRQKYGLLTNSGGGIIDDLMIQNLGDRFVLVVNAACKQRDFDHLRRHLGIAQRLAFSENLALLALQGPASAAVLAGVGHDLVDMRFMDVRELDIYGVACTVSRSGYSGEDGFELSMPADKAEQLARLLLSNPAVKLAGLGARDSLRLEAGLCLYGHDITTETTPVEAGLNWAISPARRLDGERAGGFPGADIILPQLPPHSSSGGISPIHVDRIRVGLLPEGRAPVREGAALLNAELNPVGAVTSGGFSPSLGHPVSMGYVETQHAVAGSGLLALVRNKHLPVTVTELPFVATHFYRPVFTGK